MSPAFAPVICFFERRGDEDVDVQLEELFIADRVGAGKAVNGSVLCVVREQLLDVETWALWTPPFQSVTATIVAPMSASRSAATEPTLPKPWTATRAPCSSKPRCFADSRVMIITPRPVASRRPSDPPISTGLPVTTAVDVWPTCME